MKRNFGVRGIHLRHSSEEMFFFTILNKRGILRDAQYGKLLDSLLKSYLRTLNSHSKILPHHSILKQYHRYFTNKHKNYEWQKAIFSFLSTKNNY